jgi:hypothetical protein
MPRIAKRNNHAMAFMMIAAAILSTKNLLSLENFQLRWWLSGCRDTSQTG